MCSFVQFPNMYKAYSLRLGHIVCYILDFPIISLAALTRDFLLSGNNAVGRKVLFCISSAKK